jgi:hypothetical protein
VHAVLFAPASNILLLCMQCFLPLHQSSFRCACSAFCLCIKHPFATHAGGPLQMSQGNKQRPLMQV